MLFRAVTAYADTEFIIEQITTADGLANNTVRHIIQDSKGQYWFATSNGLSKYSYGEFTNYHPLRDKSVMQLNDQRVKSLYEFPKGYLWITTATGLNCFNLNLETFVNYNKEGIKQPQIPDVSTKEITDAQGRIWKITDSDGLYIINKDKTEHYTTNSKNNPLPTNSLKCIYQDKDGVIWVGTDNLGVSKITVMQNDGVEYLFEGENIRTLSICGNDKIAIGNKNGEVWIFDDQLNKQYTHQKFNYNTYCIVEDNKNNVWRGTKGGGLYLNNDSIEGLSHDEIYSLYSESDTCLWVGTFGNGLIKYNPSTKTAQSLNLGTNYGSKRIRKIIKDNQYNLWIATSYGVYAILSKHLDSSLHLCVSNKKLYSDEIRTIFKDSHGRIYIAETGEGFAIYDNGNITHYTQGDSLVNNMVQCFVEDRDGFVWISTEFGISRFNPATRSFKNYFFSRNMLNNVYSENCGTLLADGRIAFGSNNGVIIITPAVYNNSEKATNITVEDLTINGQSKKQNMKYIFLSWWKSPWFYFIIIVIMILAIFVYLHIHRNNSRFHKTIIKLKHKKEELVTENEELLVKNNELIVEKQELTSQKEELIEEKELLKQDIQIQRDETHSAGNIAFIQRVEDIAKSQLSNPDFSADDFAEEMGLGRTIFFRKMKETTGYTPKEYIKLKRIHHAAYLISTTSDTISEIAFKVGINDPLYFSRVFKAEYKCTPTEWRKANTKS